MNNNEKVESPIQFLLFKGKWENEGVLSAIENEDSIIICAAGKDFCPGEESTLQVGKEYLFSKKNKIKAIIIHNTNYRNIGLLESICQELPQIPIYSSIHSKIILNAKFPKLKNKTYSITTEKPYSIGSFKVNFLICNSYLVGNLGVNISYENQCFFILEDFYFSSLLDNELFYKTDFFFSLEKFLLNKKEHTYLITSCQNIHWFNDNSLFFIKNSLPNPLNNTSFFIFYEFDWLHIYELLEIIYKWKKRAVILNPDFLLLIKRILPNNSHLRKIIYNGSDQEIQNNNSVFLLVTNPQLPTQEILEYNLKSFDQKKLSNIHFVLGLLPTIGGERKLAKLIDFLYQKSDKVTNLNRKKKTSLRLGISFTDLQMLIKMLNPSATIILNNSYKSQEILSRLPNKSVFLENNHSFNAINHKLSAIQNEKNAINSLEEILIKQRKKLKQVGLVLICVSAQKVDNKIELIKAYLEKIATSSFKKEILEKLRKKIIKSWERIIEGIKINESEQTIKAIIERRLINLIKNFVYCEYNKDIEEVVELITLFLWKRQDEDEKNEEKNKPQIQS